MDGDWYVLATVWVPDGDGLALTKLLEHRDSVSAYEGAFTGV